MCVEHGAPKGDWVMDRLLGKEGFFKHVHEQCKLYGSGLLMEVKVSYSGWPLLGHSTTERKHHLYYNNNCDIIMTSLGLPYKAAYTLKV